MSESPIYWYSVAYEEAGARSAAYGSSQLAEQELIASLTAGNYLFLENLLYWQNGVPRSMEFWTRTDHTRIYINPKSITSVTPMRADPRTIIKSISDTRLPKSLRGMLRRWILIKLQQAENKLKTDS